MRPAPSAISCAAIAAAIVLTLVAAPNASASTVTLTDIAQGAYVSSGLFGTGGSGTPSGNYLTGNYIEQVESNYRSFFTFDLSAMAGTITSAQFDILNTFDQEGPAPLTLNLYAYSGSIASLDAGTAGTTGYAALSSGTFLGSVTVAGGSTNELFVNLNSSALSAIQSAEGADFAIAGNVAGSTNVDFLFGSSSAPSQLVLTTPNSATPEPSSLLLLASGALGLGGILRRKGKQAAA
jgi:hypothetical protein